MVYHDSDSMIFHKGALNVPKTNKNLPKWFRNPLNERVTTKTKFLYPSPYWTAYPLGREHVLVKVTMTYRIYHGIDSDFDYDYFQRCIVYGYDEVVEHIMKGPKGERRKLARRKEDKNVLLLTPLGMSNFTTIPYEEDSDVCVEGVWNAHVLVSSNLWEVGIIKDIIRDTGNLVPTTFIFGLSGQPSEEKYARQISSDFGSDYLANTNTRLYRKRKGLRTIYFYDYKKWEHLKDPEFDFQRATGYIKWLAQQVNASLQASSTFIGKPSA